MTVWTLAEARAALPRVKRWLADARQALDAVFLAENAMRAFEKRHPGCDNALHPQHEAWAAKEMEWDAARAAFRGALAVFGQNGVHLKDLHSGLVDFHAMRGKELVFLCWREGEDDIAYWHTIDGGFAGRRPVPETIALDV